MRPIPEMERKEERGDGEGEQSKRHLFLRGKLVRPGDDGRRWWNASAVGGKGGRSAAASPILMKTARPSSSLRVFGRRGIVLIAAGKNNAPREA